jgi:hypothetical protein
MNIQGNQNSWCPQRLKTKDQRPNRSETKIPLRGRPIEQMGRAVLFSGCGFAGKGPVLNVRYFLVN